nr:neurofilament medium polypeptide-like [Aegilops tauschii subsp. strangulata]
MGLRAKGESRARGGRPRQGTTAEEAAYIANRVAEARRQATAKATSAENVGEEEEGNEEDDEEDDEEPAEEGQEGLSGDEVAGSEATGNPNEEEFQVLEPPRRLRSRSNQERADDKETGGEHQGKEHQEVDPTKGAPSTIIPGETSLARASTDDYVHTGISPTREDIEGHVPATQVARGGDDPSQQVQPAPTSPAGGDKLMEVAVIAKAAAEEATKIAAVENPEHTNGNIQEAHAAMEEASGNQSEPARMDVDAAHTIDPSPVFVEQPVSAAPPIPPTSTETVTFQANLGGPSSFVTTELNFEEEVARILLPLAQQSTDAEDIANEQEDYVFLQAMAAGFKDAQDR